MSSRKPHSAGVLPIYGNKLVFITNSQGNYYIFPKGHVEAGEESHEAAQRESQEEAGIEGPTDREPFFCIRDINYHVMRVEQMRDQYLESDQRERLLMDAQEALKHEKVAKYVKDVIEKALNDKIIN